MRTVKGKAEETKQLPWMSVSLVTANFEIVLRLGVGGAVNRSPDKNGPSSRDFADPPDEPALAFGRDATQAHLHVEPTAQPVLLQIAAAPGECPGEEAGVEEVHGG